MYILIIDVYLQYKPAQDPVFFQKLPVLELKGLIANTTVYLDQAFSVSNQAVLVSPAEMRSHGLAYQILCYSVPLNFEYEYSDEQWLSISMKNSFD